MEQNLVKATVRENILDTAKQVICHDRQNQYGDAEDSFRLIADLWGSYLRTAISKEDVAHMMILLKIARTKNQPFHKDNYVDICGYGALAGEMAQHHADSTIAQEAKEKIENIRKQFDLGLNAIKEASVELGGPLPKLDPEPISYFRDCGDAQTYPDTVSPWLMPMKDGFPDQVTRPIIDDNRTTKISVEKIFDDFVNQEVANANR